MVEYIYKCDHCGEKVKNKSEFYTGAMFKSREYNVEFNMSIYDIDLCIPCAKKAIIDIGQQFLTDKVRGKENDK